MLNIAVIGAGHLGEFHIKLLKSSKLFNLIGFFDPNKSRVKEIIDNCIDEYIMGFGNKIEIDIEENHDLLDGLVENYKRDFRNIYVLGFSQGADTAARGCF